MRPGTIWYHVAAAIIAAVVALATTTGTTFAGSQPSIGIVGYNIDEQISYARSALREARNLLVQATKKADTLKRQAGKTADLVKKLALLQEAATILRTSVQLKNQIDALESALEDLSVQREAIRTAQRLAEEQQALKAAQEAELALALAGSAPSDSEVVFGLPATSLNDIDSGLLGNTAQSTLPIVPPVFASWAEEDEYVANLVTGLSAEQKAAGIEYGTYAILMNNVYQDRPLALPDEWFSVDVRSKTSGFQAEVFERRDPDGVIVEVVIAFAGTNQYRDMPTGNLSPKQNAEARELAAEVYRTYFECVSCDKRVAGNVALRTTGHSLGGALAKVAAPELKAGAITFNSSWWGSESHQIAQIEEAGEILDVLRSERGEDVTLNLVTGGGPIANHTGAYLMARVLSSVR